MGKEMREGDAGKDEWETRRQRSVVDCGGLWCETACGVSPVSRRDSVCVWQVEWKGCEGWEKWAWKR